MNKYYLKFFELLENEDRYGCVKYAIDLLESNKVTIPELYQEVIKPSIENITCKVNEKNMCIWQEHIRSAIVRTVIESCYIYVMKEVKFSGKGKVVVLCPEGEYHDIGARMINDFFTIAGYESIFVGSDTPKSDFLAAVEFIKPDYIAISVNNYYNLVASRNAIESIKKKVRKDVEIIAGGLAFKSNKEAYKTIGADKLINTFEDIMSLGGV